MSVTTTSNPVSQSVLNVLADYEVHHSGDQQQDSTPAAPNEHPNPNEQHDNPENWPRNYQRIPNYRPINRELDAESRPAGSFFAETVFIMTMLNGCRMQANMARFWRATGGQVNDRIFYYKIGGEK